METYCVKCRNNTKNLNSKIFKTKNGRLIMQSKCADCGILLSNLGIKTKLKQIKVKFHC